MVTNDWCIIGAGTGSRFMSKTGISGFMYQIDQVRIEKILIINLNGQKLSICTENPSAS